MRSRHVTLAANTVSDVTLQGTTNGVQVVYTTDPTVGAGAPIYFTVDGSTPAVAADGTFIVVPLRGQTVEVQAPTTTTKVRLISTAAVGVSVIAR